MTSVQPVKQEQIVQVAQIECMADLNQDMEKLGSPESQEMVGYWQSSVLPSIVFDTQRRVYSSSLDQSVELKVGQHYVFSRYN